MLVRRAGGDGSTDEAGRRAYSARAGAPLTSNREGAPCVCVCCFHPQSWIVSSTAQDAVLRIEACKSRYLSYFPAWPTLPGPRQGPERVLWTAVRGLTVPTEMVSLSSGAEIQVWAGGRVLWSSREGGFLPLPAAGGPRCPLSCPPALVSARPSCSTSPIAGPPRGGRG